MRFLKTKIALAKAMKDHKENSKLILKPAVCPQPTLVLLPDSKSSQKDNSPLKKRKRTPGVCYTPEKSRATKNIVKNYGKAICKFITSPLALPYLAKLVEEEVAKLPEFFDFVKGAKGHIDGLFHFRSILLTNKNDDEKTAAYRRIFRNIGEIFIKYFSVNWIYHSKILHKKAHLCFRFKMLRRIKCPELFTYLKTSKDGKKV